MKTYIWKNQYSQGEIQAKDKHFAKALLLKENIHYDKLQRKPFVYFTSFKQRITQADITNLLSQINTMIESGINLSEAIQLISQNKNKPAIQSILQHLSKKIHDGHQLSHCLDHYPQYFNETTRQLIAIGEETGQLELVLQKLIEQREQFASSTKKLKKALTYPCVLLLSAFTITYALLAFVVPQLQSFYTGFDAELPAITKAVIALADFLKAYSVFLLLLSIAILFFTRILIKQNKQAKAKWDVLLLQLPIFGKALRSHILARCASTLALTLNAGLTMLKSMEAASRVTQNTYFQTALLQAKSQVKKGDSLYSALQKQGVFSKNLLSLIKVGEASGQLTNMLNRASLIYEKETQHIIDQLETLLEPCILIVLGLLIAFLLIAMYLPIFKIGTIL